MVEAQSFDKNFKFSSSFQLNFYYPTKGQCFMRYFHPHTDGEYNDTIEHKMFDRLKEKTKHGPGLNEVRIGLLIYKRPMVILLSIMLPMGLLSLINCAIFLPRKRQWLKKCNFGNIVGRLWYYSPLNPFKHDSWQ
jgi:hypothetical protein